MTWPNPNEKFPIEAYQGLGFLKNFIQDPNIIIGDYTYYDDPEGIENFEKNVLYRSPMIVNLLLESFVQLQLEWNSLWTQQITRLTVFLVILLEFLVEIGWKLSKVLKIETGQKLCSSCNE